jgi:hypothetical protein
MVVSRYATVLLECARVCVLKRISSTLEFTLIMLMTSFFISNEFPSAEYDIDAGIVLIDDGLLMADIPL